MVLAEDDPYHLRFDVYSEDSPALTCARDLLHTCGDEYWGFITTWDPAWTTAASLDDGPVDLAVWLGPESLVEEAAAADPDRWLVTRPQVWTQIAGLAAAGGMRGQLDTPGVPG